MVKLTDEIKESLTGTQIVFLATSSKDSIANAVSIETFTLLHGETPLISDQFFNKTLQNLKENPKVFISWWEENGGYQLKGLGFLYMKEEVLRQDVAGYENRDLRVVRRA